MIMLHDAHVHINDKALIHQMKLHHIEAIANVSDSLEYRFIKELQKSYDKLYFSAGIHPWKADSTDFEEMLPILNECKIIGEIGLDNIWCNTDMNKQIEIFEKQLQLACTSQKPVILHTKGMEKEILERIRAYPNTYLVHWYSSDHYIQEYADLGCYFTIGVSVGMDEAVNQVVQTVPLDHLLLETDGIDAVSWADGACCTADDYAPVLKRSVKRTAGILKMDESILKNQLNSNFHDFLKNASL